MKEIKTIIKAYDAMDKTVAKAALATVVRVEGSSYRRTGARMLVTDDGVWVGGISGGCLEGDALKRARLAMAKSVSTLITYDTTEDDGYQVGVGLGCNGVIDVLFTPLNFDDKHNPVEVLKSCIGGHRQTHILITITDLKGDWANIQRGEALNYTGPESLHVFKNDVLEKNILNAVAYHLSKGKSAPQNFVLEDGRELDIFVEILSPEINMVIVGFQYDVYPLSKLLKEMGWRVTIVANPQKLNPGIIPLADEIITPDRFHDLAVDEYTAIILMSHDYKTDKYNLPKALATPAPYIGILGPRARSEKIQRELVDEGYKVSAADLERIHAPVGLDIGAVTPEEIALALLAEVKATIAKRDGGFLRLRQTTIHERD